MKTTAPEEWSGELTDGPVFITFTESSGSKSLAERILHTVRQLADEEKKERKDLNIILADDDALRELNRTYRQLDQPTDVLSFNLGSDEPEISPSSDDPGERGILEGDVYVSIDRAREQARTNREHVDDEIVRLVLHGVLHLCGWEHDNDVSLRRMMNRGEKFVRCNKCGD